MTSSIITQHLKGFHVSPFSHFFHLKDSAFNSLTPNLTPHPPLHKWRGGEWLSYFVRIPIFQLFSPIRYALTAHLYYPLFYFVIFFSLSIFFLFLSPSPLHADIVTDGSIGPAQTLSGPEMTIPESLGTLSGKNLFHSFQSFNIAKNQSATFTGSDTIANVISRVTGGELSTIDGGLVSQVGNADFFFINPSGVMFGPNATIDVPAAFHVSTADNLHFTDGTVLNCTAPETSTLTQAAPEAFGFLGKQRSSIEINGSVMVFEPESSVSITAGDIAIQPSEDSIPLIGSENGSLYFNATGDSAMEISGNLRHDDNDLEGNNYNSTSSGSLLIRSAGIGTSGDGGGNISLHAGEAQIEASLIGSEKYLGKTEKENRIDISINKTCKILNGTQISTTTWTDANAGEITIEAETINFDGKGIFTGIYSQSMGDGTVGNSGQISLTASESIYLMNGAQISTNSYSNGNAGNISIDSADLIISGGGLDTGISSSVGNLSALSFGGAININLSGSMTIEDLGHISSDTFSMGDAGSISVSAEEILINGNNDIPSITGIWSESSSYFEGNAGVINITTKALQIANNGIISSDTASDGDGGSIRIESSSMIIENGGEISSNSWWNGNAGNLQIIADSIQVNGHGQITGITSQALGTETFGDAGDINIDTSGSINVTDGGWISSITTSNGDGGEININARDIIVDAYNPRKNNTENVTGIYASSIWLEEQVEIPSTGNTGNIHLTSPGNIEIKNSGSIAIETNSNGNGGIISINTGKLSIDNNGKISSATVSNGNGGKIEVSASKIELINDGSLYSSANSNGNAGDIYLTSEIININSGGNLVSSTFSNGDAGNIFISGHRMTLDDQGNQTTPSIISSGSFFEGFAGNAGDINIFLSGTLEILDESWISSETNSNGNGGNITINANNILIDNMNNPTQFTGIWSSSEQFSKGDGGFIDISATDTIQLLNGGTVSSESTSIGSAGNIDTFASILLVENSRLTTMSATQMGEIFQYKVMRFSSIGGR